MLYILTSQLNENWGDASVDKMLAAQVKVPEFRFPRTQTKSGCGNSGVGSEMHVAS